LDTLVSLTAWDSLITAVGLAEQVIVMVLAIIFAILVMMVAAKSLFNKNERRNIR